MTPPLVRGSSINGSAMSPSELCPLVKEPWLECQQVRPYWERANNSLPLAMGGTQSPVAPDRTLKIGKHWAFCGRTSNPNNSKPDATSGTFGTFVTSIDTVAVKIRQIRSQSRVVLTPLSFKRDHTELINCLQSPPAIDGTAAASSSESGTFLLMLALVKCTNRSSILSVLYLQEASEWIEKKRTLKHKKNLTYVWRNEQCPDCIQKPLRGVQITRGHISWRNWAFNFPRNHSIHCTSNQIWNRQQLMDAEHTAARCRADHRRFRIYPSPNKFPYSGWNRVK